MNSSSGEAIVVDLIGKVLLQALGIASNLPLGGYKIERKAEIY